ncbi:flagellar filament capping protein FliD [Microbacterium sp.]|uniref:flagellar filament capping protein FliD n=1 Tax=Microbacterium sp. TaxID=51671 RepID=UPI003A9201CC
MGLSLDGLVSGLDTTALIKSLMDVEAIPRNLLAAKQTDKSSIISQLQSLNASMQSLADQAKKAASATALSQFTTSSSSPAVTVTAGPDATPTTAAVVVDQVARAHTVVTAASVVWPEAPPVLTIENAAGERIEVTAESTSLQDVARAVTGAGAGVTATVVRAGTDAGGAPTYRLQLIADEAGQAARFRVYRGDLGAVATGTAADVATAPGGAVVTIGSDAQLRLWAGTDAEQVVISSGNTFTALFPGVDVTVTAASAEPATITVAADATARTKTVGDFVAQVASVLSRIDKGSTATVPDGSGGTTRLGVFTGDSTVRALRQALADAVGHPVDGKSPSMIGISFDRYGVLSFDSERFAAALAQDPDGTQEMFTEIAARVQDASTRYGDKYDGLLTTRIVGQQNEVASLGDQISRWDVRLEQRKASLQRTYAHLETMLSQLQSQSSYLASQLASLPSTKNGSTS